MESLKLYWLDHKYDLVRLLNSATQGPQIVLDITDINKSLRGQNDQCPRHLLPPSFIDGGIVFYKYQGEYVLLYGELPEPDRLSRGGIEGFLISSPVLKRSRLTDTEAHNQATDVTQRPKQSQPNTVYKNRRYITR